MKIQRARAYLPVDGSGRLDPDLVRRAVNSRTILITVMHANNETGTVQPIEEIGEIARELGIRFHTDAAQSVGKIRTDVDGLGADLLSVAAAPSMIAGKRYTCVRYQAGPSGDCRKS